MQPKEEEKDSIQEQAKDIRIQEQERANHGSRRKDEREEENHPIP